MSKVKTLIIIFMHVKQNHKSVFNFKLNYYSTMHNLHLNNKTSSKKRVSDLFANNLPGAHDVI